MPDQNRISLSVALLGTALGAFVVLFVALASDSDDCRGGSAWVGVLIWASVIVGALAAFLAPIVGGNLHGWRAVGSVVVGIVLAAVWIFAALVVGIYFVGRAGCFD